MRHPASRAPRESRTRGAAIALQFGATHEPRVAATYRAQRGARRQLRQGEIAVFVVGVLTPRSARQGWEPLFDNVLPAFRLGGLAGLGAGATGFRACASRPGGGLFVLWAASA